MLQNYKILEHLYLFKRKRHCFVFCCWNTNGHLYGIKFNFLFSLKIKKDFKVTDSSVFSENFIYQRSNKEYPIVRHSLAKVSCMCLTFDV